MTKKQEQEKLITRLSDFFLVYFDTKTAAEIRRHPGRAIPMIKESVSGVKGKSRLTAYAAAMSDAVAYQELLSR